MVCNNLGFMGFRGECGWNELFEECKVNIILLIMASFFGRWVVGE